MAGQQNMLDLIPGGSFINFLHNSVSQNDAAQAYRNPTPYQAQVQQQQANDMRRARIGYGIRQERQQAGLPDLADHELNAEIDRRLLPQHLQPAGRAMPAPQVR